VPASGPTITTVRSAGPAWPAPCAGPHRRRPRNLG